VPDHANGVAAVLSGRRCGASVFGLVLEQAPKSGRLFADLRE
jgi:hypothetical protein